MSEPDFLPERWLDAFAFGARVLGGGDDPWSSPSQMGPFLRELDGYLGLSPIQIDAAGALAAVAPPDFGNAEKRLLDSPFDKTLSQAISSVTGSGLAKPLVLALPGPGTLAAGGNAVADEDDIDDAALALVDVLRDVFVADITALALDETIAAAFEYYAPLRNLARDRDVPLVIRAPAPVAAEAEGGDLVYTCVAADALLDGTAAGRVYAALPADADPDQVLAQIRDLRAA